ncbi:reverse transcriptase domain-containing protein [Tanacetum coccineum]
MHAFMDSKLVANQVEGSYEAKGEKTKKYKKKALEMIRSFNNFQISYIPRKENRKVDTLSKLAAVQCRKSVNASLGSSNKNWFGIPTTIITDNETQLINDPSKSWVEGLGIQLISTSVYHPQANGVVERANQSIMQGIKTRLHQEGGAWVEELPNKIGIPTRRTIQGPDEENKEALRLNLNLLEEQREIATIREARQKQQVEKYYNQRVRHKQVKVGEFVLRKNELSKVENTGKLGPKWERSYEVVEAYGTGAYKLRSMEGAEIPRT